MIGSLATRVRDCACHDDERDDGDTDDGDDDNDDPSAEDRELTATSPSKER